VSVKRARKHAPISPRNAELILEHDKFRALEGSAAATRVVYLTKLLTVARLFDKDFDRAAKEDFKDLVMAIDSRSSGWSRVKLRTILRSFIKWERQRDDSLFNPEYPEEVRWIRRGVKSKDLSHVKEQDCWTEDEMLRLIAVATSARDAAVAATVTETGGRIGELGSRCIGDVYQDDFGYMLHLFGKTGERDIRVLYSGPHLTRWLNAHPRRDDPSAPLFINLTTGTALLYGGLSKIIRRLAQRAGIHKPCNTHIFRHSRATILLEQGWPEPMVKAYLGWSPSSRELGTYSHMKSAAANTFMLKMHGIETAEKIEPKMKVQLCPTCRMQNGPEVKFCARCGRPLSHRTILEHNHEKKKLSDELDEAFQDPDFIKLVKPIFAKIRARRRAEEAA